MQPGTPMSWADTGFGAPNNFANSGGAYNYTSGTATSTLNGQFVRISDNCGAISLSSANGTLDFGGNPTDHDCVTPGFGGPGNTSASRSCFYETNKIKEQARGWLPANTWLQGQLTANVNIPITCNAFWDGTTVNFYRSGGGCRNTGEIAAVFDHEWGHGMDDNDTGGGLSNSSEGYADIAAIYRLQASCVGHGFFQTANQGCGQTVDGTGFNANEAQTGASHCDTDCSGVRDSDWAKHTPNTPDTPTGFVCTSCLTGSGPCGRQVHCAAAPSRQSAWDLVARDLRAAPFNLDSQTAFLVGNKLFYQGSGLIGAWHSCTCGGTSDGCGATNGYMQWITADDDDGNLGNGTPHMTAINAAFARHNMACAAPAPQNSGCSGGPANAPTVTATPGNNQVLLTWTAAAGATRYWVFRSEGFGGCNFGKALIAEVTGLTFTDTQVVNGRPYAYNVVAAGASSACYSPAGTCLTVTPVPAAGPNNLVATASAPNVISLVWTPEPAAASYRVYRAVGACPQPNYTLLASNVPTPTYNDTTVSGGITYSYVVTWVDSAGSESGFSNCDDATATGQCTVPPVFAGVASVSSAGTSNCALDVAWAAATPSCPSTTVKYNVYRSLTPGFTPSASNLRQSCVNALTFQDTNVLSGTRYYYKVRAEDSTTNGSGLCNSGNEDQNLVEASGVPRGPSTTITDNVESGGDFWTTAGGSGSNPWSIVTTASHSPTHSWFVADPAVVTDQSLATVAAGNIPAGFVLSFWHRYNTEAPAPPTGYDGHVLEYSLDGTTWTDILGAQGPIPANAARFLQNGYDRTISTSFQNPLSGRQAWSGDNLAFQEVRVNMADFAGHDVLLRFRFGSDNSVSDVGVWVDDISYRFPGTCTTVPTQAAEAAALAVDGGGNGVLQPGETADVSPTWRNIGSQALALTGAASNFTGPTGPTYTITDAAASYGTIPVSGQSSCTTAGDCYAVSVTGTRPGIHWDSTILETVNPSATTKTWTLHVGDSFTDVAASSGFYRFIETILHNQITGGCGGTLYCPSNTTTREQMAPFVLVSKEGPGYNPPACAPPNLFSDVPETSPFCKFIEELATRGVVAGCGANLYCPSSPVTREQMSVFVLRTLDPTLNPPACVAGSEAFADVPASSGFCKWIEELARRGVVTGCGGGNYCPTAPVTREQMSVFLTVTFGLQLYGL
jgi:hypothetical protein